MKLKRSATSWAVVCVLALFGAMNDASGQTADDAERSRARLRYAEALRKMDTEKYAEASAMLEEILAVLPDLIGAKLTLAECYSRTGKLASASKLYDTVEAEAARSGQDARRKVAIAKRKAIEPRMARLRIVIPDELRNVKGLVVMHDGVTLETDQWGIASPADRGAHAIEARIPGETPWKKVVDVWQDGATLDVTVDMPMPYKPPPPPPVIEHVPFWTTERVLGASGAGLGVVGLTLGIGFGAAAIAKKNESNDGHCNAQNQCDSTGLALRRETMSRGNVSTAMFITGGILAATGAAVFFLVPEKGAESSTKVGIGPSGVVVSGRF